MDANLQRNIRTLAHYDIARGFGDGTFRPYEEVARVQVIALLTRAMVDPVGAWTYQADTLPGPTSCRTYTNVDRSRGHCQDLATYTFYAGAVPGTTLGATFADFDQPATRRFFAQALYQVLAYDRIP